MENFSPPPFMGMRPRVFCRVGLGRGRGEACREGLEQMFAPGPSPCAQGPGSSCCHAGRGQQLLPGRLLGTSPLTAPFQRDDAAKKHLHFGDAEGRGPVWGPVTLVHMGDSSLAVPALLLPSLGQASLPRTPSALTLGVPVPLVPCLGRRH